MTIYTWTAWPEPASINFNSAIKAVQAQWKSNLEGLNDFVDNQTVQLNASQTGAITISGQMSAGSFVGDGSGLTGIASGTGGVINTGSTTVGADSDADNIGVIDLQTKGVTRQRVLNNGEFDILDSDIFKNGAPWLPDKAIGNITSPLVDLDLQNSLNLVRGAGSVTFTGPAGRTYVDRYGVVQTAGSNVPRFEKEGILLEGVSENLCIQSEDFSTSWATSGATIATNSIAAPDGNVTADKLVESALDEGHNTGQTITSVNDVYYTYSVFAKKAERDQIRLASRNVGSWNPNEIAVFDLTNGTIISDSSGTAKIKELDNGWYRLSLTALFGSGATSGGFSISLYNNETIYQGDGSSGLYIWGAQFEELPFASSYIPTTTTAVTRAVETLDLPYDGNISDLNDDLTIIADFDKFGTIVGSGQDILNFDNTSFIILRASQQTTGRSMAFHGSVATAAVKTAPLLDNIKYRIACTYNSSNSELKLYVDGIGEASVTVGSVTGTKSSLRIGRFNNDNSLYGHISLLKIYNRTLTASEMRIA